MNFANGALTEAVYYILLSLLEPRHGYGIMQNAESLSNGRVKLAAGTLYGALNTLLDKGSQHFPVRKTPVRKSMSLPKPDGKRFVRNSQDWKNLSQTAKHC